MDITTIPISELLKDRDESEVDNGYIELYLASGGDPERYKERHEINQQIIAKIDAEIERRAAKSPTPPPDVPLSGGDV